MRPVVDCCAIDTANARKTDAIDIAIVRRRR
jgi:hypothetical protein